MTSSHKRRCPQIRALFDTVFGVLVAEYFVSRRPALTIEHGEGTERDDEVGDGESGRAGEEDERRDCQVERVVELGGDAVELVGELYRPPRAEADHTE